MFMIVEDNGNITHYGNKKEFMDDVTTLYALEKQFDMYETKELKLTVTQTLSVDLKNKCL